MEFKEWEGREFNVFVVDASGGQHTIEKIHDIKVNEKDIRLFRNMKGIRVEAGREGQELKYAEMELVAEFNGILGYIVSEVLNDEGE